MRWRAPLIVLLFVVIMLSAGMTDDSINHLLLDGELEPLELTMQHFHFAAAFMRAYQLTPDEIPLVGGWAKNDFSPNNASADGPAILWIDFLPNRIVIVRSEQANSAGAAVGAWRVRRGQLEIEFLARITKLGKPAQFRDDDFSVQRLARRGFVPVWRVERFHLAYLQTKPLTFTALRQSERNLLGLPDVDVLRRRILIENAAPSAYTILEARADYQKLLLESRTDDDRYLLHVYLTMTGNGSFTLPK
jgi:hypothetical protein